MPPTDDLAAAIREAAQELAGSFCIDHVPIGQSAGDCPLCIRFYLEAIADRAAKQEREACARVAEEHTDHVDFETPGGMGPAPGDEDRPAQDWQSHVEPPFRCRVAEAIRARSDAQPGEKP